MAAPVGMQLTVRKRLGVSIGTDVLRALLASGPRDGEVSGS